MNLNSDKVSKDPKNEEIKFILKLFHSSKFIEAKNETLKKIKKYPKSYILFNILGAIFADQKQLDEAIENYKKSININPNYAQAYNNFGVALHRLNKIKEAIVNYEKAINLKSDFAEAFNNLGNAMREFNKLSEALQFFEKSIQIKSDYAEAYNNLGKTYLDLSNKKQALKSFQKALEIKPNYAEVYNSMGLLFSDLSKFDESFSSYNKAIELNPSYEKPYNNLGNLLNNLGKFDEATVAYKKAIKIKPNYAKAYSNLLFNLNYKIDFDINLYLQEANNFRLGCEPTKNILPLKYQYEKNPKKLRIGIVSSDFGNHPNGYWSLSTLRELAKKNFELIAYSTLDRKDLYSNHFKPLFLKWHSLKKKKDNEIVEQIIKDGIHILVDLNGHSAENRLPIFIYKPAPIQVTWQGQGSTGIPEIDYFIGSEITTPKNEDVHYVEKVLRLPIYTCFTPPDFDVEINSLPALKNNFITFGCINKLSKINKDVILLWSKILKTVSNSKLLLKSKNFNDPKIIEDILSKFKKLNINSDQLILYGESRTRKELMQVYNEIDIALDPFPWHGNTSTVEAAWMGVPVITLKGDRFLFHFGESLVSNLNMKDWIAKNHDEYVSLAKKFSFNVDKLSKIRANLREIALKSPVFDAQNFSKHFSDMLWKIWKKFEN